MTLSSIFGDTGAWVIDPASTVVLDLDKPADRTSFGVTDAAVLDADSTSGELPLINWALEPDTRFEQTERITIPVLYGSPAAAEPEADEAPSERPTYRIWGLVEHLLGPERPPKYMGQHTRTARRAARSSALLFAATWPGGIQ